MTTPALMFLGTHSGAGKSLMATAVCRVLARRGFRVAPFKAQNMSNNAGVTPEGGEMGRAQIVQAEAAGIAPHTDMNPVLLKPEPGRSQIVLNGRVHGHLDAHNWRDLKVTLWEEVRAAYDRLAARYDVIIMEGAGSPAEINLKAGDIVNLAMARHAGAPCVLVGDIDRGGVFAALAGTVLLLEPEERAQVHAFLVNRFRGDPSLLGSAFADFQRLAFGVPTLGVIPYLPDLGIADEDAVALESLGGSGATADAEPGTVPPVDIAVVTLPHIANFDDFAPLQSEPGVRLRWVRDVDELGVPAVVILPGTKATLADLAWLRQRGFDRALRDLRAAGTAVVGICGGYQILGRRIRDPHGLEGLAGADVEGLGLLPVETEFAGEKRTRGVAVRLADGSLVEGYEIHVGRTHRDAGTQPFAFRMDAGVDANPEEGVVVDERLWGTYVHGLFAATPFRRRWLTELGWADAGVAARTPDYDRLADAFEAAVPWPVLARLIGLPETTP